MHGGDFKLYYQSCPEDITPNAMQGIRFGNTASKGKFVPNHRARWREQARELATITDGEGG